MQLCLRAAYRHAQLDRDFRLLSIGELGRRIYAIRHIARANGYEPACRLAGGTADANPKLNYGFMYNRTMADLYGHLWEAIWMDMSAMPERGAPAG